MRKSELDDEKDDEHDYSKGGWHWKRKQVHSCQPRGQDAAKVSLQVALFCFSISLCFSLYLSDIFLLQVNYQ
jgi:hypothetical protein